MITLKKFSKSNLKKEIVNQYGSISKLKKFLKDTAINQYGGKFNEIEVYGCKISYNNNSNCFASYIIRIPHVGFSSEYALGKSSLTKAGKIRLGSQIKSHYISI